MKQHQTECDRNASARSLSRRREAAEELNQQIPGLASLCGMAWEARHGGGCVYVIAEYVSAHRSVRADHADNRDVRSMSACLSPDAHSRRVNAYSSTHSAGQAAMYPRGDRVPFICTVSPSAIFRMRARCRGRIPAALGRGRPWCSVADPAVL